MAKHVVTYDTVRSFVVEKPKGGFRAYDTLDEAIAAAEKIASAHKRSVHIHTLCGKATAGEATRCMCGASGEQVDRTRYTACPTCHAV